MNPEEFRRAGHQLVDWIADYRAGVARFPVMSRVEPGGVRAQLPVSPPTEPEPFDAVLADLDRLIVPGLSHWQHPRFFGYFPSNGELASVLGDYVSTGLGVLGLSWQSSPAVTELEEVVTDWVRQMVGLSEAWSGVIQDTASTCTLVALLCARERSTGYGLGRGGLQAEEQPLVVYASDQSHSSVEKAALLAGAVKSARYYAPNASPTRRVFERRNQILALMAARGSENSSPPVRTSNPVGCARYWRQLSICCSTRCSRPNIWRTYPANS